MNAARLFAFGLVSASLAFVARGGVKDYTKSDRPFVSILITAPPESWLDREIPYDNCFAPDVFPSYGTSDLSVNCEALTAGHVTLGPFVVHPFKGKPTTIPAVRIRIREPLFDVGVAFRQARAAGNPPIVVRPRSEPLKGFDGETMLVRVAVATAENIDSVGVSFPAQDGLEVRRVPVEGENLGGLGRLEGDAVQIVTVARFAITPKRSGRLELSGIRLFVRHWDPAGIGLRPGFSGPPAKELIRELTLDVPPIALEVTRVERAVTTSRANLKCRATPVVEGCPVWVRAETHLDGRGEPMPPPEVEDGVVEAMTFETDPDGGRGRQAWLLRFDPRAASRSVPDISIRTWNRTTSEEQVASCTPGVRVPAALTKLEHSQPSEAKASWLPPNTVRLTWFLSTFVFGVLFAVVGAYRIAERVSRRGS